MSVAAEPSSVELPTSALDSPSKLLESTEMSPLMTVSVNFAPVACSMASRSTGVSTTHSRWASRAPLEQVGHSGDSLKSRQRWQ